MKTTMSDPSTSHHDQFATDTASPGSSTGPRGAEPSEVKAERSPALDTRPFAVLARRFIEQIGPRSVWGPLLFKGGFGALLLALVAYLGHLSHRLETYGPIRALDEQVIALVETAHTTKQSSAEPSVHNVHTHTNESGASHGLAQGAPNGAAASKDQQAPAEKPACPEGTTLPPAKGILADGRVILNEATAEELTTLPGVGPARARAVVELRTRLKKFKKVEDLLRIKGIGWKSLSKLKDRVVLERPPEPSVDAAPDSVPVSSPPSAGLDVEVESAEAHVQPPGPVRERFASAARLKF